MTFSFSTTIDIHGFDVDLDVVASVAPFRPARICGRPESCHPAEGGEVEILSAIGPDGEDVDLSGEILARLEDMAGQEFADMADSWDARRAAWDEDVADDRRRGIL